MQPPEDPELERDLNELRTALMAYDESPPRRPARPGCPGSHRLGPGTGSSPSAANAGRAGPSRRHRGARTRPRSDGGGLGRLPPVRRTAVRGLCARDRRRARRLGRGAGHRTRCGQRERQRVATPACTGPRCPARSCVDSQRGRASRRSAVRRVRSKLGSRRRLSRRDRLQPAMGFAPDVA